MWLATYGDMVTLLLAFFIMLFAFSNIDVERFRAIMSAFQGAIGVLDSGTTITMDGLIASGNSSDAQIVRRNPIESPETQDVLRGLIALQQDQQLESSFSVEMTERGVVIHFTDRVLFDLGRAELKPEAEVVLSRLAGILADWPNHIRIEGHTDNLPIETTVYPSNWELSTARASRVIRYFMSQGLDPEKLSAAGYGEFRPIATNQTAEGRSRNRRVDIVLLSEINTLSEPTARLVP